MARTEMGRKRHRLRSKLGLELEAALKEALAYARGEPNSCIVHHPHGSTSSSDSPIKLSKEVATGSKKK